MKLKKQHLKVLKCDELECPFFYFSHMGDRFCVLGRYTDEDWYYKPIDTLNGKIPKWCPLKKSSMQISL